MTKTHSLPAKMDVKAASALKAWLLKSSGAAALEAQSVETIGTPALQVLLAAERHFKTQGRAFSLVYPSSAFLAALEDFGLPRTKFAMSEAL